MNHQWSASSAANWSKAWRSTLAPRGHDDQLVAEVQVERGVAEQAQGGGQRAEDGMDAAHALHEESHGDVLAAVARRARDRLEAGALEQARQAARVEVVEVLLVLVVLPLPA